MVRKFLLSLLITFAIVIFASYIVKNTKLSLDKDAKYRAVLPATMRVAHIKNESSKDFYKNIYVDRRPVPDIDDDEVLVYVKAATFTNRDYDFFKHNPGRSDFVPCSDFSGIVVRVGKKVKKYEIGDKVFGIADLDKNKGACADYVAVSQNNVYLLPYSLTFKQAATIPTPALLDWLALHNLQKRGLKRGTVLIDDAISEVGIMLTGLLVRNGFEVSAIDDESVESWVSSFGVKKFIPNTRFDEDKKQLKHYYDVVINLHGNIPHTELLDLVKVGGLFLSYDPVSIKRDDIKTIVIDNSKIDKEVFAKMARLVHLGKLHINVVKEFGIEHIRDAYMRAIKGNINGKIVINVNR